MKKIWEERKMTEIEKLYEQSKDFREYVDKYAKKHCITVGTAMTHKLVKNVADQISAKERRNAIS